MLAQHVQHAEEPLRGEDLVGLGGTGTGGQHVQPVGGAFHNAVAIVEFRHAADGHRQVVRQRFFRLQTLEDLGMKEEVLPFLEAVRAGGGGKQAVEGGGELMSERFDHRLQLHGADVVQILAQPLAAPRRLLEGVGQPRLGEAELVDEQTAEAVMLLALR